MRPGEHEQGKSSDAWGGGRRREGALYIRGTWGVTSDGFGNRLVPVDFLQKNDKGDRTPCREITFD